MRPKTAGAKGSTRFESSADGDLPNIRRPLTFRISYWLFGISGVGLSVTTACIVMYRAGSPDEGPWYYLAILFGLPSAVCAYMAGFVRAVGEVR